MTDTPTSPVALGRFLSRYAATLLGCGATCMRIGRNVSRIADSYGFEVELHISPTHVHLSLSAHPDEPMLSFIAHPSRTAIDFALNTALSRLSWQIADARLSLPEACAAFDCLTTPREKSSPYPVMLLASAANLAFCRLFGGDLIAMLLVFAATVVGYRLKQLLLAGHVDARLTFTLSAWVSSLITAAGLLFGLGSTPEVALATSVLYLIPGIPYLNSVSDLLSGHHLCAFSRFVDAAVLTACLSFGLCLTLLMMQFSWF